MIKDYTHRLGVENCSIIMSSKTFEAEGICDHEEEIYKTKYAVADIPKELIESWNSKSTFNPFTPIDHFSSFQNNE